MLQWEMSGFMFTIGLVILVTFQVIKLIVFEFLRLFCCAREQDAFRDNLLVLSLVVYCRDL
jgi:hypothetical protein